MWEGQDRSGWSLVVVTFFDHHRAMIVRTGKVGYAPRTARSGTDSLASIAGCPFEAVALSAKAGSPVAEHVVFTAADAEHITWLTPGRSAPSSRCAWQQWGRQRPCPTRRHGAPRRGVRVRVLTISCRTT